ncbi:MAG: hypothetical protein LCH77_14870 [Actinobacteria bacterium]|nr:hypothetical protein [Actinomycetota bacterium]
MATKTTDKLTASEIERGLACIDKGQQLAGHFPDAEDLDRARRILSGELTPEAAEMELHAALGRIVAEERATTNGS